MVAATSYYHFDGLGSTSALTDSGQTVTDTYSYKAFGEQLASTGATVNPFRWVGAVGYFFDTDTADYYVRARSYDPATARWLSTDPIQYNTGDANLYFYASNNPINAIDASGMRIGSAIPFTPIVESVRCSFTPCGVHASFDVKFSVPWNLLDRRNTNVQQGGYVIQEITVETSVKRCKDNVDITTAIGLTVADHFWEAFDLGGIYGRRLRAEYDDRFEFEVQGPATYGHRIVKGVVKGAAHFVLPNTFVEGSIPETGGLPATRVKPPYWDRLEGTPHNMTIRWDCCCGQERKWFSTVPACDPNNWLSMPLPDAPWPLVD